MTISRQTLWLFVGALVFAASYLIEKHVAAPWRKRRRVEHMTRMNSERIARDVENARRELAAIKNGRTARATKAESISEYIDRQNSAELLNNTMRWL